MCQICLCFKTDRPIYIKNWLLTIASSICGNSSDSFILTFPFFLRIVQQLKQILHSIALIALHFHAQGIMLGVWKVNSMKIDLYNNYNTLLFIIFKRDLANVRVAPFSFLSPIFKAVSCCTWSLKFSMSWCVKSVCVSKPIDLYTSRTGCSQLRLPSVVTLQIPLF